ncbi:tetratricopeptide repeat protein [Oceanibacterium hippocampi]|uniref:Tetratricopeptide repeat protein n=1 Tax=Oceanibacterium hippocampi TaxID=745714 RepID=A0A1Y5S3U1_9PROT|nr:tetratricopeptide repeat protein [Oceanibacterium hippocampi]SLN29430.1 Tetratricopeptide repeat protein [Oceanibacterium hippocampi]
MNLKNVGRTAALSVLLLATAIVASSEHAVAQQVETAPSEELKRAFDRAFQEVIADPTDLDKAFEFAAIAVQVGDLEAAIATLERMLLLNPDLPRVRLELGVLYFRLGSYILARHYFERALEGDDVPSDVTERVNSYLAEIDRRTERSQFAGTAFFGFRYQTNANAGPSDRNVKAAGFDATLDDQFTEQADVNAFAVGNFRHTYDFRTQDGSFMETLALAYFSRQRDEDAVNVFLLEGSTGPRFPIFEEAFEGSSWRPFVQGSYVDLGNENYFYSYGAGVDGVLQPTPDLQFDGTLSGLVRRYWDRSPRPTARDENAQEVTATLGVRYRPLPDLEVGGYSSFTVEDADEDEHSNWEGEVGASATLTYDSPLTMLSGRWSSSLSAAFAASNYFRPDPDVDPTTRRRDREYRLNVTTAVPLNDALSLVVTAGVSRVNSTLPNFEYDNEFVTMGAAWRF